MKKFLYEVGICYAGKNATWGRSVIVGVWGVAIMRKAWSIAARVIAASADKVEVGVKDNIGDADGAFISESFVWH